MRVFTLSHFSLSSAEGQHMRKRQEARCSLAPTNNLLSGNFTSPKRPLYFLKHNLEVKRQISIVTSSLKKFHLKRVLQNILVALIAWVNLVVNHLSFCSHFYPSFCLFSFEDLICV